MDVTRESLMFTQSDEKLELVAVRRTSKKDEKYPDAFVHAIRHGSVRSLLSSSCGSTDSLNSVSEESEDSPREALTMIPESVMAALTNIQRSQLRRVREQASSHLEDILRNVVKTVDIYYAADQMTREVFIPPKKMIGSEANEEERIKAEIQKIIKGEIDDRRVSMCRGNTQTVEKRKKSAAKKKDPKVEESEDEETDEETHVEEVEEPVCQVMLNIIDDLCEISTDRQTMLTEVVAWMEKYIQEPFPGPIEVELEMEEEKFQECEQEKLFKDWKVTKNIRRLSVLSEEMGLVKLDDSNEEKQDKGERRKLLEEKMNKQRSKIIAAKVFDVESLEDPRNWRNASNTISQVLEEASTSSGSPRTKQMFGNAQKQFRFITELAERRHMERAKIDVELNTATTKLQKEKKEAKSLRKKKQTLETQIEKCQEDIVELKKEVEIRDQMIKEGAEQIYELECLNEELEEALQQEKEENKRRSPPVVQTVIQQPAAAQPAAQQAAAAQQPAAQPAVTKEEPTTSKAVVSKEEIQTNEKQQTSNQAAKPKTTRKASKDGGMKAKKENKEEEKRKKQEKDKEEARRTSVVMSLKEAKAELEEIRKAGETRENLLKELKLKLKAETGKFEQEKTKLQEEIQFHKLQTESAKRKLEAEQELWEKTKNEILHEKDKLANELAAKEEIINFQEQRIQEVAREMTLSLMRAGLQANTSTARGNATDKLLESKQMLAKLHLQYEYEIDKLRTFVKRETERHQAEIRRLESEHKANLNNIYRDTSVIFRAVNRFKDCLAALFDRENLADAAHAIRNLPNLLEDETSTDPHIKLLKMAGGITELMVQMEFKMSQALINKRMEIHDNSVAKNFLAKDLEAREELLKKARELGNLQAEKLKQARDELSSQEIELLKLKHSETDRYVDLTERNKELTRQNQTLNKEITFLQKELQEETTAKETQKQEMEKANNELKKELEQQTSVISSLKSENTRILSEQKLHLKKSDMMRNIKLLGDALAAKKISQEKHMVAMTVIDKTMEVTGARLACLVKKYLLHKSWKKICEAMKEHHKNNKRPKKVEKYLQKIEERIIKEKKKLVEQKAEILQQKTEMYLHFKQMCNDLKKEHGVHLIRPTVQKVHSSLSISQLPSQESTPQKKRHDPLKRMLSKPCVEYGNLENGVQGFKFFVPEESDTTAWQFPPIETTQSSVVTPKILDMDMQKARASAQRVLTSRSCGNLAKDKIRKNTPPWSRNQNIRASMFTLPPIASLYPEN